MKVLVRIVVAALVLSSVGVAGRGRVVEAVDCESNFPWSSQTELINYEGSQANGCRRTFTTDPGVGELLDPNSTVGPVGLLTPDRVSFYTGRGFSENFLWYSPRTTITTGPNDTRRWTGCDVDFPVGGICPTGSLHAGLLGDAFEAPVTLNVIGYDSAFIVLACGNFYSTEALQPPNPVPKPTPYIDGVKFRDDDRDGVRDAGELLLPGWQIRITRVSSLIGQPSGVVGNLTTDSGGHYQFNLDGHGPGRYRVEEIPQADWKNYTPIAYEIDVDFGVESRRYTRDFGNAETVADVSKTEMTILNPPDHIDANTPTDLTVSVTVENLGPAAQVPVADDLVAVLPPDCSAIAPRRRFTAVLRRDEPITRQFTFTVTCRAPSEHAFEFDDTLTITDPNITDINPHNNEATRSIIAPVHAYTDLAAAAALSCTPETDVGVAADCDVEITVSNNGFGDLEVPVDATVAVQLSLPADCTSAPDLATVAYDGLVDGDVAVKLQRFSVVCTHRSFHEIKVSVAVTADDPHVFDVDPSNDTGGDGPSIMEVFHDASMEILDVHLTCDEALGVSEFFCTVNLDYVKTGPAPFVEVELWSVISGFEGCAVNPSDRQSTVFLLDGADIKTSSFTWTMTCEASDVLHHGCALADVNPTDGEPHAVDSPDPMDDCWEVPYCLPTVNPHGKKEPQAPGSGMNEDGFYIFGMLPGDAGDGVYIRDDASGYVFGPFSDGTRIKWVEANGTDPKITEMGGNNGNGKGQALAVDYQIHAQGDAEAFFVDEKGVEVSVTCLVPPFPK